MPQAEICEYPIPLFFGDFGQKIVTVRHQWQTDNNSIYDYYLLSLLFGAG